MGCINEQRVALGNGSRILLGALGRPHGALPPPIAAPLPGGTGMFSYQLSCITSEGYFRVGGESSWCFRLPSLGLGVFCGLWGQRRCSRRASQVLAVRDL